MNIAQKAGEFWSRHKGWVIAIAAVLLALLLGYGTGRYLVPAEVKTVEHTQVVTKVDTKIEYRDREVEKRIYVQVEKKHEHSETTTEKKVDGTTVTKTVTDVATDDHTNDTVDKDTTKQQDVTQASSTVTKVDKVTTVVNKKPSWHIGADVGYSLPHLFGGAQLGVPGLQGFVVGARVERRILGPVFLGVHGNTQGTVGLGLSGEF